MIRLIIASIFLLLAQLSYAGNRIITAVDTVGYFPPSVGNGHLGMVLDMSGLRPGVLYSATLFAEATPSTVSSIIPAINANRFEVKVNGEPVQETGHWRQILDMDEASVQTEYEIAPEVQMTVITRALRQFPDVMMTQLRFSASQPAEVSVALNPDIPDVYTDCVTDTLRLFTAGGNYLLRRDYGCFNQGKSVLVSASAVSTSADDWYLSNHEWVVSMPAGHTAALTIYTALCSSMDFSDPYNEAPRQLLFALRQGDEAIIEEHERRWADLWRGNIIVDGDEEFAEIVTSAIYNLYSSMRSDSRLSIAPMGLTSDKYFGHIFWDADTWMLPVFAILNPSMARSIVDYRADREKAAHRNASARGYNGAMFPWESDFKGEESTPLFAMTGPLEHHVTADVGIGAWTYFCVTRDSAWLASTGYPLIEKCAEFVLSRVSENADGSYSIKNVVGADEYSIGVDDNAFTNGSAEVLLRIASQAAVALGKDGNPRWTEVAGNIKYYYFPDSRVIRQHSCYNGEMTKQADVELLAYPLNLLTDSRQIEENLSYYAQRLDSIDGPAMSHAAMAVNYVKMNKPEQAYKLVEKAYRPNLRGPFHMLSETPANDAIYFMTGAGALLQAVIFGYGGVEITADGVRRRAVRLPSQLKSVKVCSPLWE